VFIRYLFVYVFFSYLVISSVLDLFRYVFLCFVRVCFVVINVFLYYVSYFFTSFICV